MVEVLYPERRWVDESVVLGWAADMWADARDPDDETDVVPADLDAAKAFLEDLGVVTFARVDPNPVDPDPVARLGGDASGWLWGRFELEEETL